MLQYFKNFSFINLTNSSYVNYFNGFNLFKKERANLLALDIGSSSIKAIEIGRNNGVLTLEQFGLIPLPQGCIEGHQIKNKSLLTEKLAEFISNHGYTQRDTALLLSGPQVVTQVLQVPSEFAGQQLTTHIELGAEKYLPFGVEELSIDFDVIEGGEAQEGFIDVLLAAAKKDFVNEYIDLLKDVNLNTKVIDVYSCVMGRLSLHVASKQLQQDCANKVIAMIDIGHDVLTLSIFKNERQIYIKEQSFGGIEINNLIRADHPIDYEQSEKLKLKHNDPAIANIIENFKEQLVLQVFHMLQFFYSSAFANKIDNVFMLGGIANLPNLDKQVEQKINLTVNVLNPFTDIDLSKYTQDNIQALSPRLSAVCGLALRSYVE